jgi:hypothetical protein
MRNQIASHLIRTQWKKNSLPAGARLQRAPSNGG